MPPRSVNYTAPGSFDALDALLAERTHKAWGKITARLGKLSGPPLDAALVKVAAAVRTWPATVHRPPLRAWGPTDPRRTVCRIVHETALYNDYRGALAYLCTCPDNPHTAVHPCAYDPRPPACPRCKAGGHDVRGMPDLRVIRCMTCGADTATPTVPARCALCNTAVGHPAVALERAFTGKVQSADGGHEMNIGQAGTGDTRGGLIVEWRGRDYVTTGRWRHREIRLEVEIKMETGTESDRQKDRQAAFDRRGGVYIFARTIPSAITQLADIRRAIQTEFES